MRPIWRRADIDEAKEYVLLLIVDDDGAHTYELRENFRKDEGVKGGRCQFITDPIPIDLVLARNLLGIAETVKLANGESFTFSSNGEWYTSEETEKFKRSFGSYIGS